MSILLGPEKQSQGFGLGRGGGGGGFGLLKSGDSFPLENVGNLNSRGALTTLADFVGEGRGDKTPRIPHTQPSPKGADILGTERAEPSIAKYQQRLKPSDGQDLPHHIVGKAC